MNGFFFVFVFCTFIVGKKQCMFGKNNGADLLFAVNTQSLSEGNDKQEDRNNVK